MAQNSNELMDKLVALCKRRGFIFQSSEIYGGINGFWDYGPLGVELKRNVKDAWWNDIVLCPPDGPDGHPIDVVGVDCTIIMNPRVWEASGHVGGFNDPMVDDKETNRRYRADHIWTIRWLEDSNDPPRRYAFIDGDQTSEEHAFKLLAKHHKQRSIDKDHVVSELLTMISESARVREEIVAPLINQPGTLMEPRPFNLMFPTYVGAVFDEDNKTYLRPETAQGIFTQFWNVVDTSRVKVPFGIAQMGKAFRNEVTPRNFTFRSREFEQMEIEFFIHPSEAAAWYEYWRQRRYEWWQSLGLAGDNLQMREHEADELAHYAKDGAGTADIEYRFPFTAPGFGELEGVAHRTDYDLRRHAEFTGQGDKMRYFDQQRNERYFPHVIEPSGGADRGMLALLCEAYTPTPDRSGAKEIMAFAPRMAPIKAGIFPLVNKDGMPEVAEKLYKDVRRKFACRYDVKQAIGKRYARMDEAGTPYCFTIDGQTLDDQTVTVRDRDSTDQQRINIDTVIDYLTEHIGG